MAYINTVSPKLPLVSDSSFGYAMNTTITESVSQNLKCLLLYAIYKYTRCRSEIW